MSVKNLKSLPYAQGQAHGTCLSPTASERVHLLLLLVGQKKLTVY